MAQIEILDDVLDELADLMGIYGACKHDGSGEGCQYDGNRKCCRVGFMIEYACRIRQAIKNEEKLNQAGL